MPRAESAPSTLREAGRDAPPPPPEPPIDGWSDLWGLEEPGIPAVAVVMAVAAAILLLSLLDGTGVLEWLPRSAAFGPG